MADQIDEVIQRSRQDSGVPDQIEDPAILSWVASQVRQVTRASAA